MIRTVRRRLGVGMKYADDWDDDYDNGYINYGIVFFLAYPNSSHGNR